MTKKPTTRKKTVKAKKTKKNGRTLVAFLLDETGSMGTIKDDTIGGFNEFIGTLRKEGGIDFIFMKFDSNKNDVVHDGVPIKDVAKLTDETYVPGAMTPLIDSSMKIIRMAEAKEKQYSKIQVAIQTDGYENSSREFTASDLSGLVKEKTDKGWMFTFLVAGIDSFAQAKEFGIPTGTTIDYGRRNSKQVFAALANNSIRYAATGDSFYSSFTEEERKSSVEDKP